MKRLTENKTLAICLLLALIGIALRVPQINAGDWPARGLTTTHNARG